MKKLAMALIATAGCSAVAQAQSNVTVYGSVDAGVRYQTNTNAAGKDTLSMGTGNYNSNRLGFHGTEDLGDGLKAQFRLESGYSVKTGAQDAAGVMFNRTASVGLSGSWGAINLGRQYTVAYRIVSLYDPFRYKFSGIVPLSSGGGTTLPAAASAAGLGSSATSGNRFSNDIQYDGKFGPVMVRAEYALGEVAGDMSRNSAKAIGAAYTEGPLAFGGAYTRKQTAAGLNNDAYTVGGAYQFGAVRIAAGYSDEVQKTATSEYEGKITWAGASYKVTPALDITGAIYQSKISTPTATSGKRNLYMIGSTYALSKRTNLYAEIDRNKYTGVVVPATGQRGQTGVSFGVNHLF
ncbi:porin [Noviherbaspirillum sp. Root189]|uniref:porin n=1 Tax=Noviherbaspirillum sp. Root189 TaxID=1736487 RepID=UPI0009EB1147|nr:porin [Noviherbaspirillum sp. Root189]